MIHFGYHPPGDNLIGVVISISCGPNVRTGIAEYGVIIGQLHFVVAIVVVQGVYVGDGQVERPVGGGRMVTRLNIYLKGAEFLSLVGLGRITVKPRGAGVTVDD